MLPPVLQEALKRARAECPELGEVVPAEVEAVFVEYRARGETMKAEVEAVYREFRDLSVDDVQKKDPAENYRWMKRLDGDGQREFEWVGRLMDDRRAVGKTSIYCSSSKKLLSEIFGQFEDKSGPFNTSPSNGVVLEINFSQPSGLDWKKQYFRTENSVPQPEKGWFIEYSTGQKNYYSFGNANNQGDAGRIYLETFSCPEEESSRVRIHIKDDLYRSYKVTSRINLKNEPSFKACTETDTSPMADLNYRFIYLSPEYFIDLENGRGFLIHKAGNFKYSGEMATFGNGRYIKVHGQGQRSSLLRKTVETGEFREEVFVKGRIETEGMVLEGEFGKNGVLHGKGKVTYADGSSLSGDFVEGRLVIGTHISGRPDLT